MKSLDWLGYLSVEPCWPFFPVILYHFLVHGIVMVYVFMCHLCGNDVQHFAVAEPREISVNDRDVRMCVRSRHCISHSGMIWHNI